MVDIESRLIPSRARRAPKKIIDSKKMIKGKIIAIKDRYMTSRKTTSSEMHIFIKKKSSCEVSWI